MSKKGPKVKQLNVPISLNLDIFLERKMLHFVQGPSRMHLKKVWQLAKN